MNIPDDESIRYLFILMTQTRDGFRTALHGLQQQVTSLNETVITNMKPRLSDCEDRLAKIEDDMDDRFRDQENTLKILGAAQEDFPVDRTIVCTRLFESLREKTPKKRSKTS